MTTLRLASLLILVLSTFAAPGVALAQARIVLMGSDADRAALAPALQVELAARGADLVLAGEPAGTTRVARGASAQATARQNGALAAVWPDSIASSAGPISIVCVAPSVDRDARQAFLQATAASDPRAFAAIAAQIIDEMLAAAATPSPSPAPVVVPPAPAPQAVSVSIAAASSPAMPPVVTSAPPAPVLYAAPSAPAQTPATVVYEPARQAVPVTSPADTSAAPEPEPRESSVAPFLSLSVLAGGFVADPYSIGFGGLRAGLGMRFGALRIAVEGDVASALDQGVLSPFVRLGGSVALELPLGPLRAILGAQARASFSELAAYDWEDEWRSGEWLWAFVGGGRAALAIPLGHALDLELGADIDITVHGSGAVSFTPTGLAGITWR